MSWHFARSLTHKWIQTFTEHFGAWVGFWFRFFLFRCSWCWWRSFFWVCCASKGNKSRNDYNHSNASIQNKLCLHKLCLIWHNLTFVSILLLRWKINSISSHIPTCFFQFCSLSALCPSFPFLILFFSLIRVQFLFKRLFIFIYTCTLGKRFNDFSKRTGIKREATK